MILSGLCYEGSHDLCQEKGASYPGYDICTCSCHGDEPPAGVREPRAPSGPLPALSATKDTPTPPSEE